MSNLEIRRDLARLRAIREELREIRAVHSVKRSNTNKLYHALSHAIHDMNIAVEEMKEKLSGDVNDLSQSDASGRSA